MTESREAVTSRRFLARDNVFVMYPSRRPAERLFVHVKRVAKDESWADIGCYTWAVHWSKRIPLVNGELPGEWESRAWGQSDLNEQEKDHMAKLHEEGVLK